MSTIMSDQKLFFFFSSRRRHTIFDCDWSSDVCSSDLAETDLGNDRQRTGDDVGVVPGEEERERARSEERRVGKECRRRCWTVKYKTKSMSIVMSNNHKILLTHIVLTTNE